MARALRIEYEGAFYHITARGNEGKRIFFSKGVGMGTLLTFQLIVRLFGNGSYAGYLQWITGQLTTER